jgi:hypothetical protein
MAAGELILRFGGDSADDPAARDAARRVRDALGRSGLALGVDAAPAGTAPAGAKAAEAVGAAALLVSLLPTALEGVLQLVTGLLTRPGAPPVEITIEDRGRKVAVRFDPRTLQAADTVRLAAELRRQVFGEPAGG